MKTVSLAVAFFVILCASVFAGGSSTSPANPPSAVSSAQYLFQENFAANNITEVIVDDEPWIGTYSYILNIGFTIGKRIIYDGTIQLLEGSIYESALAVLNKAELRLLRNTIYARHGMVFQSSDLTAHFRQFSWYNPTSNNVEARLTDQDRWNIERIQTFENAEPNHNLKKSDIVGYHLQGPVAAWSPEINIHDDNTIQMVLDWGDSVTGSYIIENGFLVVFVSEQYVGTPDFLTNNSWHWPNGVTYRDGMVIYHAPIRMVFPVGNLEEFNPSWDYDTLKRRQIGLQKWL